MRARTELMLWGVGKGPRWVRCQRKWLGKDHSHDTTPSYLEQESPFDAETDGLEDVPIGSESVTNAPVSTPTVVMPKKAKQRAGSYGA
jgi:hypothetical protein